MSSFYPQIDLVHLCKQMYPDGLLITTPGDKVNSFKPCSSSFPHICTSLMLNNIKQVKLHLKFSSCINYTTLATVIFTLLITLLFLSLCLSQHHQSF